MSFFPSVQFRFLILLISPVFALQAHAQAVSRAELDATKSAIELRILEATADAALAQREAELRQATREAERAALLARLPPATSRPLDGSIDTRQFGAAGLVRAFAVGRA